MKIGDREWPFAASCTAVAKLIQQSLVSSYLYRVNFFCVKFDFKKSEM